MNVCKPSVPALSVVAFVAVLFFLPFFISPANAQANGIARLRNFKGDIIIKSNGKWGTAFVKNMPLYNGDKVVTREGTAYVIFHDGSVLKIESNSNVRIVESNMKKGFVFKNEVKERRIRVLLGKTRYKEQHLKGRETRLEAPTAVAALRGTEISFGVDDKGTAYGIIIDGNWHTIGDIMEGEAPDLSYEIAERTPVQSIALIATKAAKQAAVAASKAHEATKAAAQAGATATQKLTGLQEQAGVAKHFIEQALAAAKEGKVEAEMMGKNADPKILREALEAIKKSDSAMAAIDAASAAADQAVEAATNIAGVAQKALKTENTAGLNAALEAANAQAEAALAQAGIARGNQALVDAQTAGATDIAKAMEQKVAGATELAAQSAAIATTATLNAQKAAEAKGTEAEAFAQAAKAGASAAGALSSTVLAGTVGVIATVAGAADKASEAFRASLEASQSAEKALALAAQATDAAEAGDLAGAAGAAETAKFLEVTVDQVTQAVLPESGAALFTGGDSPSVQVNTPTEQSVTQDSQETSEDEEDDNEPPVDDTKREYATPSS